MKALLPTEQDLLTWSLVDTSEYPADLLDAFDRRRAALTDVVSGDPLVVAAKTHRIARNTLSKMLADALELAHDGKQWGWRSCIPFRRLTPAQDTVQLPIAAGPGALNRLFAALPELGAMAAGYTKRLPTHVRRAPAFENFFSAFIKLAREKTKGEGYPCNVPDLGRRALIQFLQRLRKEQRVPNDEGDGAEENDSARQLKELFNFNVMERLEFDAHRMDAKFTVEVEDASGITALRTISCIWLLLLIDSVSRLVLGWSLVIGRGYTQADVLRVFARALVPWMPRDLLAEQMAYVPGSGIGTVAATGAVQRGLLTALDNALAHHSKLTTTNLTRHFKGVLSYGCAHVPEVRGFLEALFRLLEIGAIRHLPGGFEPPRDRDTPKRYTNSDRAEDHPLNMVALYDLLDVILCSYNATPLAALGDRSPLDIVRHHVNGGGWTFESSLSSAEAGAISVMRFPVTIRGNQKKGRQPFVNFLRARYRSSALIDRWNLVGTRYLATTSIEDIRFLTLYDECGEVFVRLKALPPWSKTAHDLDLRKLIARWVQRKLFKIVGVDDAIDAYRTYVRTNAALVPAAADQMAKYPHLHDTSSKPVSRPAQAPAPRGGYFTFDNVKDPI